MSRPKGWTEFDEPKVRRSVSLTDFCWDALNQLVGSRKISKFLEKISRLDDMQTIKFGRFMITKLPEEES